LFSKFNRECTAGRPDTVPATSENVSQLDRTQFAAGIATTLALANPVADCKTERRSPMARSKR
jgi:hypothetical protein